MTIFNYVNVWDKMQVLWFMNLMYKKETKLISISITTATEYILLWSHLEFTVLASLKCILLLIIFSKLGHKVMLWFINTMCDNETQLVSIVVCHIK